MGFSASEDTADKSATTACGSRPGNGSVTSTASSEPVRIVFLCLLHCYRLLRLVGAARRMRSTAPCTFEAQASPRPSFRTSPSPSSSGSDSATSLTPDLCLDKTDGLTVPGTQVQVWECVDGNTNQEWGFTPRGPCGPNACTTWPYPGSTPSVMYR